MATQFSGTPFNTNLTREVVTQSPPSPQRQKPGPKPGYKKAGEPAPKVPQPQQAQLKQTSVGSGQTVRPHSFVIDKSLVDYLFMKQEELAQKQIIDYDAFVKGMMYVASKQLSLNAPDTLWSNFLTQLITRTVNLGSKGVSPR
jgi:hypothetical protein